MIKAKRLKPIRIANFWISLTRYCIHGISLIWLIYAYYSALTGRVNGDPVEFLTNFSGIGTLNLLLLTLIVSPLARTLKFGQLVILRKTLGVYAAIYALFHFYIYIAYELEFEWLLIANEIIERPYITVGFVSLLLLSALLITSFTFLKRKMGTRWQKLHNWIYVACILGCVHFLWSVKSDISEPIIYSFLFLILLLTEHRRQKFKKLLK
ncbi:protein-methionine-sulfoxide reductase heme-binding subunit MsrQ [Glaciecola sp. 1036]|uniref:protein-methionine-sulfoxide reductase heme-binding subunit MsrQ n=1 Tax=Alteromonadaceae TaxID=72275 RepID=UPI003D022582